MKIISLMALTVAAGAGALAAPSAATGDNSTTAPVAIEYGANGVPLPAASWAPLDTADSLWRRGRIAIAEEAWDFAARTFERLADRYPDSEYAGDALYWQAFALQRVGGHSELQRAVRALELQAEKYPKAATFVSGESNSLLNRVNGRLARTGDADAAVAVAEVAAMAAEAGVQAAAAAMPMVEATLERLGPELQRGMAEATRGIAEAAREMRGMGRGWQGNDPIPPGCESAVDDGQVEALNALLQMDSDRALPILKRVLERRDKCSELLRRQAVFLVSQKNSDEAVDILLNTAKTDPDGPTREKAVFWLSQTDSERAVEVLEQILLEKPGDARLQNQAVFSLSQHRSDRAQAALRAFARRDDVPTELRADAIFWLGQESNAENQAFLREIFPGLRDQEMQEKVIFSLSQAKSRENARWLLERAKDRSLDSDLRKSALFWAGQSGAAVADLAQIYDTSGEDTELRKQVIFALSQNRSDEAVTKMIDIARREQDDELRKQAIFWLGQSGDARAVKALEEIINRPI